MLDIYDPNGSEVLLGQRGVKFYRDGTLYLNGIMWEPLSFSNTGSIQVPVFDPYVYFGWRRVRAAKTYTAVDAATIPFDRISIQNGYGNTLLVAGTSQVSVNRTLTVAPGQLEADIIGDNGLSGMSQGYFFKITPVDNVVGTMAQMDITYPNAGATRENVRFEFGANTLDNLADYYIEYTIPKNRITAAGTASTGGRVAVPYEDTTSEGLYNIIEDEIAYSNISDTTLLSAFASAAVRVSPPVTYKLTPSINSPLLFQDFDIGDFVRLNIQDGPINIFTWVRIVEATLSVDKDGTETLSSLVVETLVGDKPVPDPADAWRKYMDQQRFMLESLNLKVQTISAGTTAPSATGSGSGVTSDPTYTPPPPASTSGGPAPPPAPDSAPTDVTVDSAAGIWYGGLAPGGSFVGHANPMGLDTVVWFEVVGQGTTPQQSIGSGTGDVSVSAEYRTLTRNTAYTVVLHAKNSAGETVSSGAGFTVPNVQAV